MVPAMAEIVVVPNRVRPGVGLPPARVTQRPWLPQHSRHCPVLEAGSAIGYLVYPALRMDETLQVAFNDTAYQVTYARGRKPGQWEDVFQLTFTLKVGSCSADLATLVRGCHQCGTHPKNAPNARSVKRLDLPKAFALPSFSRHRRTVRQAPLLPRVRS